MKNSILHEWRRSLLRPLIPISLVLYIGNQDYQIRGLQDAKEIGKISDFVQTKSIEEAKKFLRSHPRAKEVSFIMSEFDAQTVEHEIRLEDFGFRKK